MGLKATVAVEVVAQIAVEEHLAVAEVLLQPTVCVVRALERRTQSLLQIRLNWIHRLQMVQLVFGISQQQRHQWNRHGKTSQQTRHMHPKSKRSSHPRSLMVLVAGLACLASPLLLRLHKRHLAQSPAMMLLSSHQSQPHQFQMIQECQGYRLL